MATFHEAFWWFGVTLFTVSTILFYGLMGHGLYLYIKDKLTNK